MSASEDPGLLWRRFLDAVESGDAKGLAACVADEVTMFLPLPDPPGAVRGRAAVLARFERLFATMRAARPGPKLVAIKVMSFSCREFGGELALGESTLAFGGEFGRRSILFAREAGRWQIVHLHGSNLASAKSRLPVSLG